MLGVEEITDWLGQEVRDSEGESLGKLEDVYCGRDGRPQLALVKHGLLGRKHTFVPLANATVGREYVRVAYSSRQVADANDSAKIEAGERIDGVAAEQLGRAFGAPITGEGLDSATALQERRAAAREAEERAAELETEAREHAQAANSAQASAQEHSGEATDAQQAAERARREADRLQP